MDSPKRALVIAGLTTAAVTVLSHADKLWSWLEPWTGALVGATFLGVTFLLAVRGESRAIRAYGLSLGGLTEPEPEEDRRVGIVRSNLRAVVRAAPQAWPAIAWAVAVAAIIFPPFWIGYRIYWGVEGDFVFRLPERWWDQVLAQLLVIALAEEAFYRGYLQSALERGWTRRRWNILGAKLGVGWLVVAVLFAAGHYLALPHPNRLAVFFPALVFGWLRERTGGVGAPIVFHALCNLLVDTLALGYSH